MAIVIGQSIPSELLVDYSQIMTPAFNWKGNTKVRRRYPWHIPRMQTKYWGGYPVEGWGPSKAQLEQRAIFRRCVDCWKGQRYTGGYSPYYYGWRNRQWWYSEAQGSGLWYYDYFMQQTLNAYLSDEPPLWCSWPVDYSAPVNNAYPDRNYAYKDLIAANYEGILYRSYLKNVKYWHNSLWIIHGWGAPKEATENCPLKIYSCSDSWSPYTITWNNMPELGDLIGEYTLPYEDVYPFPRTEIPFKNDGVESICLVVEQEGKYAGFYGKLIPPEEIPYFII